MLVRLIIGESVGAGINFRVHDYFYRQKWKGGRPFDNLRAGGGEINRNRVR
jgi:hypothetical protein